MNDYKLSKLQLDVIQDEITVAQLNNQTGLLRRALYKTSDSEVSKDLVQTTFMKTLLYLQKGGKIDLMHSFLNHVLNDLIVDEYRKKKPVSLDILQESGFDPGFSDMERQIDYLDGQHVASLIPQLSKKYELVIRLRYIKGLSLKEISLITGQSENTVAVQVHRGIAKLKEHYQAQASM